VSHSFVYPLLGAGPGGGRILVMSCLILWLCSRSPAARKGRGYFAGTWIPKQTPGETGSRALKSPGATATKHTLIGN
jgi:hypothetical protein